MKLGTRQFPHLHPSSLWMVVYHDLNEPFSYIFSLKIAIYLFTYLCINFVCTCVYSAVAHM